MAASDKSSSSRPDPQVTQRSVRRTFSVADRLRILDEVDACTKMGEVGAILRREGLYSSTLCGFRKQRAAGKLVIGREKTSEQARQVVWEQHREKEASRQRDNRKIAGLEAEIKKLKILLELQKKWRS